MSGPFVLCFPVELCIARTRFVSKLQYFAAKSHKSENSAKIYDV